MNGQIMFLEDRVAALENFVQSLQNITASGYAPVVFDASVYKNTLNETIVSTPVVAYTSGQVAEKIGISDQTVRRYLRDGILKGVKMGGGNVWRVSEEALRDFIRKS